MTWLLTGGAGYIGAHVLQAMRHAGHEVVVLDDLSTGDRSRVPAAVPLIHASVLDTDAIRDALSVHRVTGVVHLAAKKAVEESIRRPLWYYEQNVEGFRRLLIAMEGADVDRLVLSSSAAVYGSPNEERVTESAPLQPINPYGETKVICEWMARAVARRSGMRTIILRYFNVAGAANPDLGDPSVANLIPLALRALAEGVRPRIFGDDYDTADGTCIRDYIHVQDLAEAHVAAVEATGHCSEPTSYNVSRGEGYSVREIIQAAQRVTGLRVMPRVVARRPGDPPRLVGSAVEIEQKLGWRARLGVADMVASAWKARPEFRSRQTLQDFGP